MTRAVEPDHDLCRACRAFLLGDTDLDPRGAVALGDALGRSEEDIFLGQSSCVTDLFDETAHEIVPSLEVELAVELHGGLSDGATMRVASARDGSPPEELFTPVGMDHGVVRTERYVLDESSGPDVWWYDLADPDDISDLGSAG